MTQQLSWIDKFFAAAILIIQHSGTPFPQRGNLNFLGGVTVTDDPTNDRTTVTINAGGGVDVQDESTPVATALTLNFVGAGVVATDSGGGVVEVDIPGGSTTPTGTGFVHITSSSEDGTAKLVVNADVDAAAAIAGSKISPNFGSQNVTTTGTVQGANVTATAALTGVNLVLTGGERRAQTSSAIDITLSSANYHVTLTAANKTATLPASPTAGDEYRIKAGNVTGCAIAGNGHNIDGATPYTLAAYECVTVQYNGTEWEQVA